MPIEHCILVRLKPIRFGIIRGGAWPQDKGLRIDYFLLSPEAADKLVACEIDRAPRGKEKASDHTPLVLTIA